MKILRLLLLILHLAVAALLCIMLLNKWLPASLSTYPNLLSLGFPFLISVHIFLTLLWILMWKKRAFLFIIMSIVFYNATRRWVNYSPKQNPGNIKVLTMNTKGGRFGQTALNDFIKNYSGYDVVLLQEDIATPLQNCVKYKLCRIGTTHRIISHGIIFGDGDKGSSVYADINFGGRIIRVVNVYLEPFQFEKSMIKPDRYISSNEEKAKNVIKKLLPIFQTHQRQVEQIRTVVARSPYPVILAGDFNSVPNSYEYFNLINGLDDAFLAAGRGSGTSFHDYKFPIRIDYIFTSPAIKARTYIVDRSIKRSDHYPVIATFDFK